jgi:hypothetical protein
VSPRDVGDDRLGKRDIVNALFLGARIVAPVGPRTFDRVRIGHDEMMAIGERVEAGDLTHLFGALAAAVKCEDDRAVRLQRDVQKISPNPALVAEGDSLRLERGRCGQRHECNDGQVPSDDHGSSITVIECGMPSSDLRPAEIVDWTDAQLDDAFRREETLPLEGLLNAGGHRIDVDTHEIYNDANWKGFLPKGLPIGELAARLSVGYAKRFWKRKGQFLGETIYPGGILVKHTLEEVTIDQPTHDLSPGRYLLLKYTDPVFEHIFYDVMKLVSPDLILYRGYSGRFPDGRRGWTAPLMRRFSFAQMGKADHAMLVAGGSTPAGEDLLGAWQLDTIATSNQLTRVARVQFERTGGLHPNGECDTSAAGPDLIVPEFVTKHFHGDVFPELQNEIRKIDGEYVLGRWTTDISGPYAKLLLAGSQRLFWAEKQKGAPRRFTMYYVLRRSKE